MKNKILIADGGSSKVDWRLVDKGKAVKQIFTKGMNPFFRTKAEISEEIKTAVATQLKDYDITDVYFFGAGCVNDEKSQIIHNAISENISVGQIHIESDLLGAAISLCGNNKGIACILGTGSNSCYYDGNRITGHISPLGYILGDEGSGAVLGRLFIGACLKNQLGNDVKEKFLEKYKLTPTLILDKIYKEPVPNRFLASFSPFILRHIGNKEVYNLVYKAFKDFFIKNVMQYDFKQNKVHFTGSIAYYYQHILLDVAKDLEISIGKIQKSPMDGLIKYYCAD